MRQTAIIYHYFALYRLPILRELMNSREVVFTLFSGIDSEIQIKKVSPNLSKIAIEKGGLRWSFLKNNWLFKKKFLWQSGLISLVFSSKFDSFIFLGSPYFLSTWISVLILRLRGKKAYFWMHGVYKEKPTYIDFLKMKFFYRMAHGFFLYGNRALGVLKRFKVKDDKDMHVIYNSLDYNKSLSFRRIVSKDEVEKFRFSVFNEIDIPVVVFIGRLNFVKRIDMLIESMVKLKIENGKNVFNLLVIGDGEEKVFLENKVEEYGLDFNCKFLGAIYEEQENANYLLYSDLCVIPGEVGLTAMHAMSYGVPVISHNNLDIQMPEVEAINCGISGDLYEFGDVKDLSKTIYCWLEKYPIKTRQIMESCFSIIDLHYNPSYQRKVIESVLANDLNYG